MKLVTIAILASLLFGCDANGDPRICGVGLAVYPPVNTEPKGFIYRQQVAYACVEQWAARLSRGSESPASIAEAALGACEDAIMYAKEERAKELGLEVQSFETYAPFWRRRATLIAVQARAGKCYKDA